MSSLLFAIGLSAVLSLTSLFVVLFRISPLLAPVQAIPAFFLSLFLTVSSIATLLFYFVWRMLPIHAWDNGKILGISVRQGVFLGTGTVILLGFHLLGLLTWWIAILIYAVFILIELAIDS